MILKYIKVLVLALVIFLLINIYSLNRYGFLDLFIINKSFANLSLILLSIVLLIGPGSRLFSFPDRFIKYRKEIGIVSFFLAFFHVLLSLFFLPSKFPLNSFFNGINLAFIFGLLAIFLLMFLFLISGEIAIKIIGRRIWWLLQYRIIRIAFIFIFLHVFFRKFREWFSWYQMSFEDDVKKVFLPDFGIFVWWFMVFVIFIRIAEYINPNLGRLAFYFKFFLLPLVYLITFFWRVFV